MLHFLFAVLMLAVFGKLFGFAFKATWGITKMVVSLVVLPVFLILLVVGGLLSIAFPILIVVGICSLVASAVRS